eukprot:COSAG02_NODE_18371_length_943_cov_0.947867_1_plen_288_part_01
MSWHSWWIAGESPQLSAVFKAHRAMRAALRKNSRLLLLLLGLQLPVGAGSVDETTAGIGGLTYTVALKPGAMQAQRRIRAGGVSLSAAAKPETVRMMDRQGRAYTCELPSQAVADSPSSTRASPSPSSLSPGMAPGGTASNRGQALDSQAAPASPPAAASTVDSIMALLSSGCIKKNTGWWTYEVCHGDEVRQYHPEQNKVDSSQSWSLGRIDVATRPLVVHNEPKASTPATGGSSHVAVEFAGGQFCDEIKAPRSGELHYICDDAAVLESSRQPSVIQSIDESTKCR